MQDNANGMERPGASASAHERRHHQRKQLNTAVRLRGSDQRWRVGTCTDIGAGGMGIDISEVLSVGEIVEVEFLEADGNKILRARVMYRQHHHYGLALLDPLP